MIDQPSIAFVNGVDQHGAQPPSGFPHRFAVLTWFEHDGGMADPWPLLRAAIPRIGALVHADSVVAEYWERKCRGILFRKFEEKLVAEIAWAELMQSSNEALHEQTFPSRFRFMSGDCTALVAETEAWSLVGGPMPYHDSVTISFFSAMPMHEELHRIFTEEAIRLGILIEDTRAS